MKMSNWIDELSNEWIAKVVFASILFCHNFSNATTYYTVANGDWNNAIWSSVCSTCAGNTLPALSANDVIIIDNQVTIDNPGGNIVINVAVTIRLRTDSSPNTSTNPAKLIFGNGGKLSLATGSSFIMENTTGNPANNPIIDGTGSGASNLIEINNVIYWQANFGDLPGVGTLQPGGALPITLASFTVQKLEHSILINWVTVMERNFDRFVIERSASGLDFKPIAEVRGQGRDIFDIETKYSAEDKTPLIGFNYYRLKAVDLDETFEYFGVRVVKFSGPNQLSVYPNPSSGKSISFGMNFNPSEDDKVLLTNNLGVELLRASVKGLRTSLILKINLNPEFTF